MCANANSVQKAFFWRDMYSPEMQTLSAAMLSVHRTVVPQSRHVDNERTIPSEPIPTPGDVTHRLRMGWVLDAPRAWKSGGAFACRTCPNTDSVQKAFFWRDMHSPETQTLSAAMLSVRRIVHVIRYEPH